ncbi:hypothetical protein IQ07DRAFT_599409 [Pyrenochaeta sp. DS3sAY3a]|nr:hypothetical protein IQ07DRAFT_599409 [Pyrenochaeta sp. DS3sAY3a]
MLAENQWPQKLTTINQLQTTTCSQLRRKTLQKAGLMVWIPVPRDGPGPGSQPPWFKRRIWFLDLPTSIRSRIYEEVGQVSRRTTTVCLGGDDYIEFDAVSIPLSILGTCSAVHLEASPVLQPRIDEIMIRPPGIHIPIEVALAMFPFDRSSQPCKHMLQTIMHGARRTSLLVDSLHAYRRRIIGPNVLGEAFGFSDMLDSNGRFRPEKLADLNAIVSFTLLAAKYAEHHFWGPVNP